MRSIERSRNRYGQTVLEAAIVAPLFLVFAFLGLQVGHIGIGMAIVNYSASSIARQAVEQNGFNQGDADAKFKNILFAGLQSPVVKGSADQDGDGTANITVTTCAEITAFPLVGPFFSKTFHGADKSVNNACTGANGWMGPVGIKGPPYHFMVQGHAVARFNYNSGK